ncbi:hypothetical protein C8R44DRAFT_887372 [Mycena epipterygia]|nr:hypothetical protein C8R44DRAFT_887372 [Mycena epipterygia]
MNSTQTIDDARPPFSPSLPEDPTPAADIILRSCDGIEFHAHEDMLLYSSHSNYIGARRIDALNGRPIRPDASKAHQWRYGPSVAVLSVADVGGPQHWLQPNVVLRI